MSNPWKRELGMEVIQWLRFAREQGPEKTERYGVGSIEMPTEHCRRAGWLEAAMIIGGFWAELEDTRNPHKTILSILAVMEARCNEWGNRPDFVRQFGGWAYHRNSPSCPDIRRFSSAPYALECAIHSLRSHVLRLVCHHSYRLHHAGGYDEPLETTWDCDLCGDWLDFAEGDSDARLSFRNLSMAGALSYHDEYDKAPAGIPTAEYTAALREDDGGESA